ncbi:MAG TPA: pyrroline-5-carboxylate reductase [Dehalococcoidia bacterium]|nr:pyrroline-5-carboxylate reductase [Dehalococcoidia bacterium]
MNIGLIGGGAMGEAIVSAVINAKVAAPAQIKVYDVIAERTRQLGGKYGAGIADSPDRAVEGADFVITAVKPQDFPKAASAIAGRLNSATVISIMAGVTIAQLTAALQTDAVVRSMPNTPAQIGEGMTGWTATPGVGETAREGVRKILGAMGKEAYLPDEKYLDMVTGLSGSGPAYVFLFIEALTDAGVHIGLSRDLAATMALQTVLGSARYVEATGKHPAELRNQVTSPGGTTAEALRVFEAGSFRSDVLEAVIAAYEKSKALGGDGKKQ